MKKQTLKGKITQVSNEMTRAGFHFGLTVKVNASRQYAYYVITVSASNGVQRFSSSYDGSTLNFEKIKGSVYEPRLKSFLENKFQRQLNEDEFRANSTLSRAMLALVDKYLSSKKQS